MSLWIKLNTLFRASAEEPLHNLVDANSIRIFEQEIRDAEKAIQHAKLQLATVMAEKKQLQRHNQALEENITNKERQACEALDKQEEELARDVAELIAEDEQLLQQLLILCNQFRYIPGQFLFLLIQCLTRLAFLVGDVLFQRLVMAL